MLLKIPGVNYKLFKHTFEIGNISYDKRSQPSSLSKLDILKVTVKKRADGDRLQKD
jgi:hypothetical protein